MYRSVYLLFTALCVGSINAQFAQFQSTDELYVAVDDYMANSTSNATISAMTYGYPMGTWDVSLITNFTRVFDPDRTVPFDGSSCGPILSPFNENITAWNVANAVTMVGMFACTEFNHKIGSWSTTNVQNMSGMFMFATGTSLTLQKMQYVNVCLTIYPCLSLQF